MKKLMATMVLLVTGILVLFANTFSEAPFDVGKAPEFLIPENRTPTETKLSVMIAGKLFSKAGLAFRGGSFKEDTDMVMGVALITHPKGNLLIDAGFASNVDEHFASTPWLMQQLSKYDRGLPILEQLQLRNFDVANIKAVILTHAHWDHVSGLADLPDTPVWVTEKENAFINSTSQHTALARALNIERYHTFTFKDGPFLGFDSSYDVFKDQSVVIVPANGHTPGSTVVFVTLANNKRYAFIGDLAWQSEGVDIPTEKPWLPRVVIGENRAEVNRLLTHMHHLQKSVPNLTVLPSHDEKAWEELNTQLANH